MVATSCAEAFAAKSIMANAQVCFMRWLALPMPQCSFDKTPEQGMGTGGLGLKFRMELAGEKEGMLTLFDRLDQLAVGRSSADQESLPLHPLAVDVVELVTVPVAFADQFLSIELMYLGAGQEL